MQWWANFKFVFGLVCGVHEQTSNLCLSLGTPQTSNLQTSSLGGSQTNSNSNSNFTKFANFKLKFANFKLKFANFKLFNFKLWIKFFKISFEFWIWFKFQNSRWFPLRMSQFSLKFLISNKHSLHNWKNWTLKFANFNLN